MHKVQQLPWNESDIVVKNNLPHFSHKMFMLTSHFASKILTGNHANVTFACDMSVHTTASVTVLLSVAKC